MFKKKLFRFFQDLFEEVMSKEQLVSYLHDLESLLFNKSDEEESLLDNNDESKLYFLAKKLIKSLIPGKITTLSCHSYTADNYLDIFRHCKENNRSR